MKIVAIVEFWIVVVLMAVVLVMYSLSSREHKENLRLKTDLIKARNEADYQKKVMELKEESYKNAKEKNKKFDTGSKRERINAAGDGLCND